MFCPNCGKKNPDDAKYCGKCGKPLPVYDEKPINQEDEVEYPKEITPENAGEVTERVFSKTDQEGPLHRSYVKEKPAESFEPTGDIGTPETGTSANNGNMGSNPEPWKVRPASQSTQKVNSSPGKNQYYIPPATVIPESSEEVDASENNTALIITIIILITLIILVGIFAIAYMRGYIDF